jgi:trehalose 6-phosphate synthase
MGRLVVASNRTATPGAPKPGGLAVALWDALQERGGGLWFGWSGETHESESRGVRLISEEGVEFALADLTDAEFDGFYLNYANRALWPVMHYRVDLARFDESAFDVYESVNRRFGRLLSQQLRKEDVVWVHDYHFLLMGRELRHAGWGGPVGFFLHIPFPAPEVFTALPAHAVIARALADYDLIGFQTRRDCANFKRYMVEHHDAELLGEDRVRVGDRTLRVGAFPIGIDPDEFAQFAESEEGRAGAERLGRIVEGRALVIGVDRMDYSKGLLQRLQAFAHLLDDHEELRGRVTFVQIAPPSRADVDAYQDLREQLDRLAGRVNSDYSDLDWTPVRYIARGYPRETLAGLYRLSRVALVTPLYDGMNLVAKEFVAAQDPEDPGVLVLSEFAGAAEQMPEALLVNPHDVYGTAEAVTKALSMPLEERRQRWEALREGVWRQDVAWWRTEFLKALGEEQS